MKINTVVWLLIGGVISLLQACVNPPAPPSGQTTEQFIETRRSMAHGLEQQDDLAAALDQWRIVQTLAPDDPEAAQAIAALKKRTESRASQLFARGRAQFDKGDLHRAELNLLGALALQPSHSEAFAYLKKIMSARMGAAQRHKAAAEAKVYSRQIMPPSAGKQLQFAAANNLFTQQKYRELSALVRDADINRVDQKIRPLLYEADIYLAQQYSTSHDRLRAGQHLDRALLNISCAAGTDPRAEKLKMRLANDNYNYGKGILAKDIRGTIAALEQALRYNPDHAQARNLLPQATRMQKNLEKIERRGVTRQVLLPGIAD